MVVALGTAHGQPKKRCTCGRHPVEGGLHAVLFLIDPALLVDHSVAVKSCGDLLLQCSFGQQIASQLLDHESVKRHVPIKGLDDPITITPHHTWSVETKAVGIGVAGHVQPVTSPALTVVGRVEQAIDQPLISIQAPIGHEGIHLFR